MRTLQEIQQTLKPIFTKYGVHQAVLFGSYAKGTATNSSDIDLLVDSKLPGLRFVGFAEEICELVGTEVDVLDISHIDRGSLLEREILDTGVVIYEK